MSGAAEEEIDDGGAPVGGEASGGRDAQARRRGGCCSFERELGEGPFTGRSGKTRGTTKAAGRAPTVQPLRLGGSGGASVAIDEAALGH
jgi:hypothetical protein